MYLSTALVAIVVILAIAVVGAFASRGFASSSAGFYLGNRGLGRWFMALSAGASAESGGTMLGLVGAGYVIGLPMLFLVPGMLLGLWVTWRHIGPRLHKASLHAEEYTAPRLISLIHGGGPRGVLMWASSVVIVVLLSAYLAAQLNGVGKVAAATFGVPIEVGVVGGLIVILAYVTVGGFRASVITDAAQAILMVSSLLLLPIFGTILYPGDLLHDVGQGSNVLRWDGGWGLGFFVAFVIGWAAQGFGFFGSAHSIVRTLAGKDAQTVRRAGAITVVWSGVVYTGAILSGLILRAWLPTLPDPEQAIPVLATTVLPPWLGGLLLAAVLSAILSTADSQMLVLSSTILRDLFPRWGDSARVRRMSLTLLGAGAAVVALYASQAILPLILLTWGGMGATIGVAIVAGVYFKHRTPLGTLAGMIAGGLTFVGAGLSEFVSATSLSLMIAFPVGLAIAWIGGRLSEGRGATSSAV